MVDLGFLINEKTMGCGKEGVKIMKIALELAPFQDKENLKNEDMCKKTVKTIEKILKG